MHLKSLTLEGFKSFPERTRLDFGPGVSVVVGPNGSGKSNVTDAVLWAMGEQSPLAVRGQSMQDVIFGGGRGVQARTAAEVEIVLDNSDGTVELPLSEISIVRRLDRSGEGSYWLNGARCRLTEVLEVLSDTGLGKETHSVISQGRVEAIVTSKPRDRRLLIEEAAGLGKHRKRRRRAQLKLERTQENLDRALDVEREARTRLRPLKRQAEAAELHGRLERQMLEARWELAREALRGRCAELEGAELHVKQTREARMRIESQLELVVERRTQTERALSERAQRHDELAKRVYECRSARERLQLRSEQVDGSIATLSRHIALIELELRKRTSKLKDSAALELENASSAESEHSSQPARASERVWTNAWSEVRQVILAGIEQVAEQDQRGRLIIASEVAAKAERIARDALERVLELRASESRHLENARSPRADEEQAERILRIKHLGERHAADSVLSPLAERLSAALAGTRELIEARLEQFEGELDDYRHADERTAGELRSCSAQEAEIQAQLRAAGEFVTEAEVAAQRLRDQAAEVRLEVRSIAEQLELPLPAIAEDQARTQEQEASDLLQIDPLDEEQERALAARLERLARRREQIGPVNPLAQQEYASAVEYVEELEGRRADLETALRELRAVIAETDRQIRETFQQTFDAAASNFERLVGDVFPGGSGRLRLVSDTQALRPVLGGAQLPAERPHGGAGLDEDSLAVAAEHDPERERHDDEELLGVEIEVTPAGKSMRRLSLLSGGEKSMTALAFLFAIFLARPCPFYILDEVEAALDDLNLDRFLELLRRYSDRAQFVVITHQKRTMEAADWLYGVSMAHDGVSKVISRRFAQTEEIGVSALSAASEVAEVA